MNSKDLRIGNYVKLNNDIDVIQSVGQWCYTVRTIEENPVSILKPIPLTEEWLIKFGFDKNDKNRWQINGHSYAIYWYSYVATGDNHQMYRLEYHNTDYGKDEYQDCHQMADRLKHVHSLQNLYMCLTGEELKLNI